MKRLLTILVAVPLFAASLVPSRYVPNRYIVELSEEPVVAHAVRTRDHGPSQRAIVRRQQASARTAIEALRGQVMGAVENVTNALLVRIPDAQAAPLAALPGVRRVYPVRQFHLVLDHALPLVHAPDAWSQVGIANAGAGIKIAFIDTGIDIGHPGFNDAGFTAPPGFPLADSVADVAFTNNKVIVARSYASLFEASDPDPSARDHVGHGTGTAMTAAGVMNAGPLATIGGVAPQAYLGSYKVFGTPGVNDSAPEDAILQAIDDAVADGMDVINLSLGTDYAILLSQDVEVQALQQAVAAGVIVVASAGNNGPDPQTVSSPADAPSVIAVGASNNDRFFAGSVATTGGQTLEAVPGTGGNSATPITAPLVDVANLDVTGLACGTLPPNSLVGSLVLIFRGTCTFESKLNNAQAAGAVGAVMYDNVAGEDPITMAVGAAALPAAMVANADGLSLKQQIVSGFAVTLNFAQRAFYANPSRLASFSARGPNVDFSIKPDLVAVGQNLYTATETADPNGALYDPSGYALVEGTSFSAPLVAGAAAVLKQARPGLTVDQYRSLLIDSASPAWLDPSTPARVQAAGAGMLNVLSALNATAAAAPVTLGFGTGGDINAVLNLTISNVGAVADRFQLAVVPRDASSPTPALPQSSVQLAPGASASIPVSFQASALAAGQYEGFITIQGTQAGVATSIPYWYAVPSGQPGYITILYNVASGGPATAGTRLDDAVLFRVTDAAGLPMTQVAPVVTVVSGGGRVMSLSPVDSVPNSFAIGVRLGTLPGSNVFQIQVGALSASFTIVGQ
jgi:minor extracellular serine protease Vpr